MEKVKQNFSGKKEFYHLIAKQNENNKWELWGYSVKDETGKPKYELRLLRDKYNRFNCDALKVTSSITGSTIIKVLQSGKWNEIVLIQPPREVNKHSQSWEWTISEPIRLVLLWGEEESLESVLKRGFGIQTILIDLAHTSTYDITEKSSNNIISLMEHFLQNGIDVNEKDEGGETALHYSCRGGNFNIVKLLLENGANFNEKNNKGRTAWFYASRRENIDIIKLLLEYGANINEKSCMGTTALEDACIDSNFEKVNLLLEQGADVSELQYPIQYIDWEDWKYQIKILKLLASKNVDVNFTDELGMTTLMLIASVKWYGFEKAWGSFEDFVKDQQEVIQILLDMGADINAKCYNEKSALHYALDYTGYLDVKQKKHPYLLTKFLLDRGADINASDNNDTTVLMLAIMSDLNLVAKYLIRQKVNINAKDNLGRTALVIARQCYLEGVYEMLRKKLGGKDESGEAILTFKELNSDLNPIIPKAE